MRGEVEGPVPLLRDKKRSLGYTALRAASLGMTAILDARDPQEAEP